MSLREEIQQDVAEAFDTDLADAVTPFDILRHTPYDPITQTGPSWEKVGSGRGVLSSVALRGAIQRIRDEAINADDRELLCLQNEVTVKPEPRDQILIDEQTYIIESVFPDPVSATFVLWLKKTSAK